MRILLVNPPLLERTYPAKAMGLDYLAKQIIDSGHKVDILDLDAQGGDNLLPTLENYKPEIVRITNLSIQNDVANEVAREIKKFDNSMLV